jgi:hypothetical protein
MFVLLITVAFCRLSTADKNVEPAVLAVVTTPTGKAHQANIARSLVPETSTERYRLIPLDTLVNEKILSSNLEIENRAKKIAEAAKEASLGFNLVHAAELRRQAADTLLSSETVALKPSLVATYLLEAGAASAEAGEIDLALVYFHKALAVDDNIRPGPLISPQAKQLFETALKGGLLSFKIPHKGILQKLCTVLNVDGILWIAVGQDEEGLIVSEKLLLPSDASNEPETRHRPPANDDKLEQWIPTEKNRIDTVISMKFPKEVKKPKPWYKQWWVYTIAGGVLAATAVGIGVGVSSQTKEADVTVHY